MMVPKDSNGAENFPSPDDIVAQHITIAYSIQHSNMLSRFVLGATGHTIYSYGGILYTQLCTSLFSL